MKASEAAIFWTPAGDDWFDGENKYTPGVVLRVFGRRYPDEDSLYQNYFFSGGALYRDWRESRGDELLARLFVAFAEIVGRDGVDVEMAYRAFKQIDEFAEQIPATGVFKV